MKIYKDVKGERYIKKKER